MPPAVIKNAKDKKQQGPAAPPDLPPPEPPDVALIPPPAPTMESLSPKYIAEKARLDSLNADLAAEQAKVFRLKAELGFAPTGNAELDGKTLRSLEREVAARALLGQGDPDDAGRIDARFQELQTSMARADVLARAVQLLTPAVDNLRQEAHRQMMRDSLPAMNGLLIQHAKDMAAGRLSRMAVLDYIAEIEARIPVTAGGLSDMRFARLGDPKCHASNFSTWIADLIHAGVLTGDEDFLEGVPLVLRLQDGRTIDRPTPRMPYNMPPPEAEKQGALGAAAAAIGKVIAGAADAVRDLIAGERQRPEYVGIKQQPPGSPPPADGPTKRITLHRSMANAVADWPAGWSGPWPAEDAANLVRHGYASWADAPNAEAAPTAAK